MAQRFHGSITALITPFADGKIDEKRFQDFVLAVMLSDDLSIHLVVFQKFAYLVGVPGGDKQVITSCPKFIDDRTEKRYMRRIIQIDPDLLAQQGVLDFGWLEHGLSWV